MTRTIPAALRALAAGLAMSAVALAAACASSGGASPTTPNAPSGGSGAAADSTATALPQRVIREANSPEIEFPTPTPIRRRPAPELAGLSGWLNSEPLDISELNSRRRVVLIDFWTYTCVNCIRTLPYLKIWHDRYNDRGLTIIGVHSPEFEFEKLPVNVRSAVERFGIRYAVAQDNRRDTWEAFNNAYWPAKYLIDAGGGIVYQHFGEGEYVETEQQIRKALGAAGWDVSGVPEGGYELPRQDPRASTVTRELYGGYDRNYGFFGAYAGQDTYYKAPDATNQYTDSDPHAHNKWYLQGLWRNESEAIVHARETSGLEDYIALKFAGRSVNVVIEPERPVEFDVVIEIDGRPLTREEAGADVEITDDGRSVIHVRESRLYAIVELPQFGIRELKLRSNSDAFAVFAFTFGVYQDGA